MAKVLAQFNEKHGDAIDVQQIDVRMNADLARLYQVRYVPTLVFLDEGGADGTVVLVCGAPAAGTALTLACDRG